VEGVARGLDPQLNLWTAAEPIARQWVESNYGLPGRLRDAGENAEVLGKVLAYMPRALEQAEGAAQAFASMARDGLRLDPETVQRMASEQAKQSRSGRWAQWAIAAAVAIIALALLA